MIASRAFHPVHSMNFITWLVQPGDLIKRWQEVYIVLHINKHFCSVLSNRGDLLVWDWKADAEKLESYPK